MGKFREGFYGNPWPTRVYGREEAIARFRRQAALDEPYCANVRTGLAGRTLGCWCRRRGHRSPACHGDVLAVLANAGESELARARAAVEREVAGMEEGARAAEARDWQEYRRAWPAGQRP